MADDRGPMTVGNPRPDPAVGPENLSTSAGPGMRKPPRRGGGRDGAVVVGRYYPRGRAGLDRRRGGDRSAHRPWDAEILLELIEVSANLVESESVRVSREWILAVSFCW